MNSKKVKLQKQNDYLFMLLKISPAVLLLEKGLNSASINCRLIITAKYFLATDPSNILHSKFTELSTYQMIFNS